MTAIPIEDEAHRIAHARAASMKTWARTAGVLLLITIVAGGFGELYIPSRLIVSADAAATANNIRESAWLFRLGFAGYLLEAVCDVALALIFYLLLKPAGRDLALLAVFFRLVSTAVFGATELFYFAPLLILGGAGYLKTFSPDQSNSLALLSLKLYGHGGGIFMVLYGVPSILFGYLIFRSGYFPRVLGVFLVVGGFGFVVRSFALVLAPAFPSSFLPLPMVLATLSLTPWLLIKGVDASRWEEKAAQGARSL